MDTSENLTKESKHFEIELSIESIFETFAIQKDAKFD